MSTISPRLIACLAALAMLPAGSAAAAPLVPLVPQMSPAKDEEIVVRFHDAFAKGLSEGGLTVLPAERVRAKVKAACAAPACAARALGVLGGDTAAVAQISTVGKNYVIEVSLIGPDRAQVSGRCDVCTLMEALGTTRKLAKQLAAQVGAKPAVVPAKTPAKMPAKTPRPDKTQAKTPGPDKTPVSGKTEGRRWPLWPALAAAGVGVLGLAIGIPLVAIDGDATNCRGTARPDGRNCQDVYSTSGAGWTFTTMGLAGLATSAVLFYLYFSSSPKRAASATAELPWLRRLSIAPSSGGLFMGASGTF